MFKSKQWSEKVSGGRFYSSASREISRTDQCRENPALYSLNVQSDVPNDTKVFLSIVPCACTCVSTVDSKAYTHCSLQAAAKKEKMDKDDEERIQEAIDRQIERALASKKDVSQNIIPTSVQLQYAVCLYRRMMWSQCTLS